MTKSTRRIFASVAFAATVAVMVTGATFSGQTREAPTTAESCATAEWPNIPAQCLMGDVHGDVRVIGLGGNMPAVANADMQMRFEVAFQ